MKNRVSWLAGGVCSLLIGGMPISQAETAAEFAYTTEITVPEPTTAQPFYQVRLPLEVYMNSTQPDLSDVAVFNRDGLLLPHALMTPKQFVSEQLTFTLFPLNVPKEHSGEQIQIQSETGLFITLPASQRSPSDGYKKIWLLSPSSTDGKQSNASVRGLQHLQLQLQWHPSGNNWRAKASVMVSEDLQHWHCLASQFSIMELSSVQKSLQVNQIPLTFEELSHWGKKPYSLLLVVESEQADMPELLEVSGRSKTQLPPEMVNLPLHPSLISEHEVEYSLPFAKSLAALSLQPAQPQSVLPVSVSLRNSKTAGWQPFTSTTLNNITNESPALSLAGVWQSAIQGVSLHSTLNLKTPQTPLVFGQTPALTLIFNAQGNGPYTLAWGKHSPSLPSLTFEQLVPEQWRKGEKNVELPQASLSKDIRINSSVLNQLNPTPKPVRDYSLWIWGGLLLAVLLLALFTLRIVREMKKGTASGDQ